MDNEEIVDSLEEKSSEKDAETHEERRTKFLIFRLDELKLAIEAQLIREIVLDSQIFNVPFLPAYILGVLNRHGEPFTVIDLNVLFKQSFLEACTFLMLSDKSNPACFLINEVLEIIKVPESAISNVSEKSADNVFFKGLLKTEKDEEVLILNIDEVFKRVEKDVS